MLAPLVPSETPLAPRPVHALRYRSAAGGVSPARERHRIVALPLRSAQTCRCPCRHQALCRNDGPRQHGLKVAGLDVGVRLALGLTAVVGNDSRSTVTLPSGMVKVYCRVLVRH